VTDTFTVLILFALLLFGDAVAHIVQWTLYREVRREVKGLQDRLDSVVSDRDEWRSVAQRALPLLVAQTKEQKP
jgi:hypothetical protein